jgi:hypothetical protein
MPSPAAPKRVTDNSRLGKTGGETRDKTGGACARTFPVVFGLEPVPAWPFEVSMFRQRMKAKRVIAPLLGRI